MENFFFVAKAGRAPSTLATGWGAREFSAGDGCPPAPNRMTSWRLRARRAAAPSARPSHASSRWSQRSARRTTSSTSCRRCATSPRPFPPRGRGKRAAARVHSLGGPPADARSCRRPPRHTPQIQELSRQLEAERTRIKLESGGEAGGRLIVVANRLPVTPVKNANGEWELKRSSGGLVSAFLGEPAPRSGSGSGRAEGVR